MFTIHPPSVALGIVIGLFFAGPLSLYFVAALAVSKKLGDKRKR